MSRGKEARKGLKLLWLTDFVALAAQVDDSATDFLSMLHCLANQYEKLGEGGREELIAKGSFSTHHI